MGFTLAQGLKGLPEGLVSLISSATAKRKRALQAWRWLLLAIAFFMLCISPGFGQANLTLDIGDNTASVSRGTSFIVSSKDPIDFLKKGTIYVPMLELSGDSQPNPIRGTSDENGKAFEFVIPKDVALGEYSTRLLVVPKDAGDANPLKAIAVNIQNSKNNKLTINSEAGLLQPTIKSISPLRVVYPKQSQPNLLNYSYSFKVFGSGFSPTPSDNHLVVYTVDQGEQGVPTFIQLDEPAICWVNETNETRETCFSQKNSVIGTAVNSRQLTFENFTFNEFTKDAKGEFGISIRIGDQSSEKYKVTFSRVRYYTPHAWAAVGLLAVLLVTLGVLSSASKDKPRPTLLSVIIDPDSKTYSLSRLQFVLWTIIAIASYLFLFLSKSLAQGKPEFIDIPNGLPAIILASASTTFFATGIDNTKGGKASGPNIDPKWSDLISAGGSVLPDRLQFFAWTLIGICVYSITVLSQNPGIISDLPTIPAGFLQLSGVSSVGYLGGKLARKPGPVINTVDKPSHDGGFLILTLNGHNLSRDASFTLVDSHDKVIYLPQTIGIAGSQEEQDKTKARVKITEQEPGDSTMGRKLTIQIPSTPEQWTFRESEPYSITLINPDTQVAAWRFDGLTA